MVILSPSPILVEISSLIQDLLFPDRLELLTAFNLAETQHFFRIHPRLSGA